MGAAVGTGAGITEGTGDGSSIGNAKTAVGDGATSGGASEGTGDGEPEGAMGGAASEGFGVGEGVAVGLAPDGVMTVRRTLLQE